MAYTVIQIHRAFLVGLECDAWTPEVLNCLNDDQLGVQWSGVNDEFDRRWMFELIYMNKLGITNHVVVWFEHEICIANAHMYGLNGFSEISLLFVKKGDNSSIVFFKYGSLSYLRCTSGQSKQAELALYKGRRKWSSKRAVYYANSVAAFHLILNCGDVEVNPGPARRFLVEAIHLNLVLKILQTKRNYHNKRLIN